MTIKIKYCLITTYSKFKTCLKKTYKKITSSCSKLFTRNRYVTMSEGDEYIVDFPDEDVIQEQKVIEERDSIYDPFPEVTEQRL